jgi:hypothetical protein
MTSQTIGSRRQVWNGTSKRTSGGLTKSDLMMSHGRIVSKSKHFSAKKEMRLLKHGYGTKKGKFGYVKIGKTKKHRKMRGGGALSPADASWERHGIVGTGSSDIGNYGQAGGDHGSASWSGDSRPGGMRGGKHRRRRHRH